jgi:hypothetical protein
MLLERLTLDLEPDKDFMQNERMLRQHLDHEMETAMR